jgi:hypothetical protein
MEDYLGYIEGYYGRLLRWEERFALVNHLKKLGLNTYVYAPKEDPLHRQEWRKAYPGLWMSMFQALCALGKQKKVNVVPALAPGLSYDYLSQKDYAVLLKKMKTFCSAGVRAVALLMDDIDDSLPKSCQKVFSSLGQAHGRLLAKLEKDLKRTYPGISLWFCPTIYTDEFAKGTASMSQYLKDLAACIPPKVQVFWTGKEVIARSISAADIKYATSLFRGQVLIWDNYYANDYCPGRIFLGPFRNRSRDTLKKVSGFLLNPTGHFFTDTFYLMLLAGYVKGQNPVSVWKQAAKAIKLPRQLADVKHLLDSPFTAIARKDLQVNKIRKSIEALTFLVFSWKSPLQREWYPYLYNLRNDLEMYLAKGKAGLKVKKKYTAVLQNLFDREGI